MSLSHFRRLSTSRYRQYRRWATQPTNVAADGHTLNARKPPTRNDRVSGFLAIVQLDRARRLGRGQDVAVAVLACGGLRWCPWAQLRIQNLWNVLSRFAAMMGR